jgi:hypothetical protein
MASLFALNSPWSRYLAQRRKAQLYHLIRFFEIGLLEPEVAEAKSDQGEGAHNDVLNAA